MVADASFFMGLSNEGVDALSRVIEAAETREELETSV
jgi:hypothetical protein